MLSEPSQTSKMEFFGGGRGVGGWEGGGDIVNDFQPLDERGCSHGCVPRNFPKFLELPIFEIPV